MAASAIRSARRLTVMVIALVMAVGAVLFVAPATPALAATGGCSGTSCVGLDPTGRCDGDAYTVHSIAIIADGVQSAGQLDLRYSPSCKANWGRFTAPWGPREWVLDAMGSPTPFYGRVTAWNPGGVSQQPVQADVLSFSHKGYSTWSRMVNGVGMACVGVEPLFRTGGSLGGDVESKGWFWGPCA